MTKTKRGKRMTKTGHYDILTTKGKTRKFIGTLLKTFNVGNLRLAIFRVPKRKKKKTK